MTDATPTGIAADVLAARWLEAEEASRTEPFNEGLAAAAVRAAAEYDTAIATATQEELRVAWEAARRTQGLEEVGSQRWADARRVAELLRTEYEAARGRDLDASPA
jgi:hypothetical protein